MTKVDINRFLNKHCRIRMRSGKEVYGVIWEEPSTDTPELYFASFKEHKEYFENKGNIPFLKTLYANNRVKEEDIILLENI